MAGEIESPQEQQQTPAELCQYWIKELEAADRHEKEWRDRGEKIVKRYRDEREKSMDGDVRYNILYANTEVLQGVMYQKTPVPDVRRRYRDKDPIGREAANVLERALSFSIDSYDFDETIRDCIQDALLPGRGVARVRFEPSFSEEQSIDPATGQPVTQQELAYAAVSCSYVDWKFFRYSPAPRWDKVRWVAFGELLTRDELVKLSPQFGQQCALNWGPTGEKNEKDPQADMFRRALVWMVWDKTKRQVLAICEGFKDAPLAMQDDPLGLEDFFPCPCPLYSVRTSGSMIPVPEYIQYQDQAEELNKITERIDALVDALRRRGIYDATFEELGQLARAPDNTFVPVKDFQAYVDKGGLEKIFLELPIEGIAKVLVQLYQQREQLKQEIYDVSGISDIVRGQTKATETLGAQELKSSYANIRINPRQGAVQKFVRGLLRLKAEIIAEHFTPEILQMMTGVNLPTAQQKLLAQQSLQAPAMGMMAPPDPNAQAIAQSPSWDDIMAILKSDKMRGFKVDIETDSTVRVDADTEQKNRTEFLAALTQFLTAALPAVAQGMLPKKVAGDLMMFGIRGFKIPPDLEETLNDWADGTLQPEAPPAQPGQPDPNQEAAIAADGAAKQAGIKAQADMQMNREQMMHQTQENAKDRALDLVKTRVQAAAKPPPVIQRPQ